MIGVAASKMQSATPLYVLHLKAFGSTSKQTTFPSVSIFEEQLDFNSQDIFIMDNYLHQESN